MPLFESIRFISGGLTFIAFIVAVVAWVHVRRMQIHRDNIKNADTEGRAILVAQVLDWLHIDVTKLSKAQQYGLAMAQLRARSVRFFGLLTVMVLLAVIAAYVALHPSAAVPKNEPADQLDVNASALDSTAPMIARPLVPDSLNNFPDSRLVAYYTAGAPDAAVYRVPFQVPIYPDSIWVRWVMDRIAYIAWLDNNYIELTSQFPKEFRDPEPDWTSIQITSVDLETDGNPEFIFALDYGSHLYTVVLKYHGAATPEGLLREDTWECVGFMSAGHSIRFRRGGLTLVAGAGNSEQWVLAGGRMIETEQLISRENPTYGSCSAHTSGG